MAKKFLLARTSAAGTTFRIHLDESKVLDDGTPDPRWVAEWTWGASPPPGRTAVQYAADILAEVQRLAAIELAKRQAASGTALAAEGTTF